ncbi:hypothetical protein [Rhodovulum steppense]|uniref:Uncharacterized protein n=1 Tax=Rhodovulum steppense TaxID=540251 RepID=A0A4V2R4L1_9RHOB|nr:hypothetical protein [Rhodovulum steppense]TCM85174.1 hypothetical protein EV216_10825 [Rhodovulum steppense]
MQTRIYTLRDFTTVISETEKRPNTEKVFNQLKGLAARGLMRPLPDRYGPKGALLFTASELFRARVLMAAIDMGLSSENLAKLGSDLDDKALMERAITDLSAAQPSLWLIEISWIRVPEQESAGVYGNWLRDEVRMRRGAADPLAPDTVSVSGTIEGALYIRFTSIALPLHAALHESEV